MKTFLAVLLSLSTFAASGQGTAVRSDGGHATNLNLRINNAGTGIRGLQFGSGWLWVNDNNAFLYTFGPSSFVVYTNADFRTNVLIHGVLTGDISGGTNINGSSIASGTVADARIASTITRDTEFTTPMGYPTGNLAVVAFNNNGASVTNVPLTGIVSVTNILGGTVIDYSKAEATTNMAGALTFTGISGFNPTNYNTFILHCLANGADRTVTPASGWGKSRSVFVVTNGTKADIIVSSQIGLFTNMAQVDFY